MRNEIIAEARTWIGTPYKSRGRIKGVEADCLFVECVLRDVAGYTGYHTGYSMMPRDRQIEAVLDADMNLIAGGVAERIRFRHLSQGNLVLFTGQDPAEPQHLAFVAVHPTLQHVRTIIHAYRS